MGFVPFCLWFSFRREYYSGTNSICISKRGCKYYCFVSYNSVRLHFVVQLFTDLFFCVFVFRRRTKLNSVWKFARYFLFLKVFDFQRCPMLSVTSLSAPQKCNSVVLKMVENNAIILVQSKWNFWFLGRINCECFFLFLV